MNEKPSEKIFISIASYCDPLLLTTIEEALKQAKFPENLRFGVVEQNYLEDRISLQGEVLQKQVRYLGINPAESRGACWARAIAMTLYEGEEWFLQIDSHMRFDAEWDDIFLSAAKECAQKNPNFLISSYPLAFKYEDGKPIIPKASEGPIGHVLKPTTEFKEEDLILRFVGLHQTKKTTEIIQGFHLGAGCIFAPGKIVYDLPYDPFLYFWGEEQTLAVRAFTRGWDIFHISKLPVYHLYDWEGAPERVKHWDVEEDKIRAQRWWGLDKRAKRRASDLLSGVNDLGVYGLGSVRTLDDYAIFSGIDYRTRTFTERAKIGPWSKKPSNAPILRKQPSESVPVSLFDGNRVGVIVPLSGKPDYARLIAMQLAAQNKVPFHVIFYQYGPFLDYQWIVEDLNLPYSYDWIKQEGKISESQRYSVPLIKLIDMKCDYFVWGDYDVLYSPNHIADALDLLSKNSADLTLDRFGDILILDKNKFILKKRVNFQSVHAPGGAAPSMVFNRTFAIQLYKDLIENKINGSYADAILAKVTAPKFKVFYSEEKCTVCTISHNGSISTSTWVRQLDEAKKTEPSIPKKS